MILVLIPHLPNFPYKQKILLENSIAKINEEGILRKIY